MGGPPALEMKFIHRTCGTVMICLFGWAAWSGSRTGAGDGGIAFTLTTDAAVYPPKAAARVKVLVENTGSTSLYVYRRISQCSGQEGSVYLEILDEVGHDVRAEGCSGDSLPTLTSRDILEEVSRTVKWVEIQPGEIFGRELTIELPRARGTFRLKAELIPPGFSAEQREILRRNGKRVPEGVCPAPVVTITVR